MSSGSSDASRRRTDRSGRTPGWFDTPAMGIGAPATRTDHLAGTVERTISLHKAQDSESQAQPPLAIQHRSLLQRSLVFTAVTCGMHKAGLIAPGRGVTAVK